MTVTTTGMAAAAGADIGADLDADAAVDTAFDADRARPTAASSPSPARRRGIAERLLPPQSAHLPGWCVALALLAGCGHAASIAWPFAFGAAFGVAQGQPLWWLQPLSLAVLVALLLRAGSVRQSAWLGWWFGTAMQCATWWWLYVSLHTYGGLAAPLAVIAIVGLAGFLALYHALVCAVFGFFKAFGAVAQSNKGPVAILFASLWLLAELARVEFFTGFPWGEGGYAQLDGPFANWAKLVGVHGLTFGAAWLAAVGVLLARATGSARQRGAALLASVLLSAWGVNTWLQAEAGVASRFTQSHAAAGASHTGAPFTVTVLQGNIPQDEKFEGGSGIPDALGWYGSQLQRASTSLVVTPETAIPLLPAQLPEGYLEGLLNRFLTPPAGSAPVAALVGIPLGDSRSGYTNSAIGLKPAPKDANGLPMGDINQQVYRYDKHHLVPFGEFVHPLFKWFLALVNIPLSDFNRGPVSQPSFEWQGQRLAPNVCYEDLFGEELAKRFTDAQTAPTMMVNISNIGWFGNTIAIDQHLAISRMRTIEFERPMVRATNTGATAVIDHTGQVTHALQRHTRGVLVAAVEGRSGITPYAWWVSRLGLWPYWGLGLLVVGGAWLRRRRWLCARM